MTAEVAVIAAWVSLTVIGLMIWAILHIGLVFWFILLPLMFVIGWVGYGLYLILHDIFSKDSILR